MDAALFTLLSCSFCSFLITYFTIPSVIHLAYHKQLLDIPDERKVHQQLIPSLGGIGIFIGVLISFTLFCALSEFEIYKYILTAYMILFFMGVRDDLLPMSAGKKFLIQIAVAGLIAFGGVRISSLFGLFGINELPTVISYFLTIFFIVGVTNAYNLIDGVDGLAGGLGGIGCITLGLLLLWIQEYNYAVLAFAITGSLIAFLRYNFGKYPNKTFMGDSGSLLLGLTITILAIQFMQSPNTMQVLDIQSPISIVLGIILIPVYDTLRVFTIRILDGKSPFHADRNHIHHEFLKSGAGHRQTSILLWIGNIILIAVILFFRKQDTTFLLLTIFFVAAAYVHLLVHLRQRTKIQKMETLSSELETIQQENILIQ